jgi:gliding motility-associated-like protein
MLHYTFKQLSNFYHHFFTRYMKRLLFILTLFTFVFISIPAHAAHIIGGDFSVEWISGNEFKPELKLFRDCFGGGAAFDPSIQITIYDSDTDTIWGFFTMDNPVITPIVLGDACYTPTSLCVEQGIYDTTITLPDNPGGYYLAWERCCRNGIITNIENPDQQGMVFVVTIADPALQNSTPVFGDYPSTGYFCIGLDNELNFNVTDPDGDSLVYFFDYPLAGSNSGPGNPTTLVAGPKPYEPCTWATGYSLNNIMGTAEPMTIDQVTGTIHVTPNLSGVYVFAVYVAEFRDGVEIGSVRREIQFQTLACTVDYPPTFAAPIDTLFEVVAENEFELEIIVDDENASDPIFIDASSDLFSSSVGYPAQFNAGTGNGIISSTFLWKTVCDNISDEYNEVNLKAYSDGCDGSDTTYFTFYVKVIPDVEGWIENAPNVFTPNGDGVNDEFSINVSLNPCYDTFNVVIYDRWGRLVFESSDAEFEWNGEDQNNQKEVSTGAYFYIIDASFQGVSYRKTSSLTLLR